MTNELDFAKKLTLRRAARVTARIERALYGLPAEEQGSILAHLLSLWIAGHFVANEFNKPDRPQTTIVRDVLLQAHLQCVRGMLDEAEKMVLTKQYARDDTADPIH